MNTTGTSADLETAVESETGGLCREKRLFGFFLSIFAAFLLTIPFSAPAGTNHDQVVVAVDAEFAPYEFTDENGKVRGLAPDILRAIGRREGIKFRFVPMSWSQAVEALRAGRVDLAQMIRTEARARRYVFSRPFTRLTQALFRHKGSDLNSVDRLAGQRIAIQRHDIAAELLKEREDFFQVPVDNKSQGFELLDMGDVDGFFAAELPGLYLVRLGRYPRVELARGGLFPMPLCFATRADNAALIGQLNKSLEKLKALGVLATIQKRWQEPPYLPGALPQPGSWPAMLLVGLVVLSLLIPLIGKGKVRFLDHLWNLGRSRNQRHAWIVILLVGVLVSLALYLRLDGEEQELLQAEIDHRSQTKLNNSKLFLEQHMDAARALAAYLDHEIVVDRSEPTDVPGGPHEQALAEKEIEGNALALLKAHPGEILSVAVLMNRESNQFISVAQGGREGVPLEPPADKSQLEKLLPGETRLQLVTTRKGQKRLRILLATEEEPTG